LRLASKANLCYNDLVAISNTQKILLSTLVAASALAALLLLQPVSEDLLGRVLEGDELLRVQVESDFDRDGDIDFQDFTVFAAFYEGE
jgi:hypothetical protein